MGTRSVYVSVLIKKPLGAIGFRGILFWSQFILKKEENGV